jgi:hypothetical protein
LDIAQRIDEDAVVFFDGFAVWIAAMVDPARVVAVNLWVDHLAIVEAKIKCVWIVLVVGSAFPGDALPSVFDNTSALGNRLHGVNTVPVHTGLANFDSYCWLAIFALLRHEGIKEEEKPENKNGADR